MNWAPAVDTTLWRLIGDVEPDQGTELDEASSEGIEYTFTLNSQAFIDSFRE